MEVCLLKGNIFTETHSRKHTRIFNLSTKDQTKGLWKSYSSKNHHIRQKFKQKTNRMFLEFGVGIPQVKVVLPFSLIQMIFFNLVSNTRSAVYFFTVSLMKTSLLYSNLFNFISTLPLKWEIQFISVLFL